MAKAIERSRYDEPNHIIADGESITQDTNNVRESTGGGAHA